MPDRWARWLDPLALGRLSAQPLVSLSAMEGTVSGHHKSPHRGSSVEFAEYRNYAPGDDIRRLDWRVFARTDRFYLKEFEAETNLRCYLVLDASGSMGFTGKGGVNKFDYARRLAAALGYLVVQQGDAAGFSCMGDRAKVEVPPKRHPSHLQLVLEKLDEAEASGETRVVEALHSLADRIRRRALVLVFTDAFFDPEALLSALQHLRYQKHDVVLFQLLDRMELDFQFDRPVRFVDLEGPMSVVTEPGLVRDEYLRQLHGHLDRLSTGCREFKVDYRRVVTDEDYERVLAGYLVDRLRLAGGLM
ncbi:MAG: DUF58 domain-containing protein [Verrucomicrobia bacterium]|nr:DUF58 domain-containing protein [Verrucomicrobiota bacterium]